MKAVVAAFNQEKALVGAFSVITNLRMDLFEALVPGDRQLHGGGGGIRRVLAVCQQGQGSEYPGSVLLLLLTT